MQIKIDNRKVEFPYGAKEPMNMTIETEDGQRGYVKFNSFRRINIQGFGNVPSWDVTGTYQKWGPGLDGDDVIDAEFAIPPAGGNGVTVTQDDNGTRENVNRIVVRGWHGGEIVWQNAFGHASSPMWADWRDHAWTHKAVTKAAEAVARAERGHQVGSAQPITWAE